MPVLSNNGRLISSLPITSTIVGQDELLLQSSGITKRINYATLSSSILSSTNFSPFNATVNFTSPTNKFTGSFYNQNGYSSNFYTVNVRDNLTVVGSITTNTKFTGNLTGSVYDANSSKFTKVYVQQQLTASNAYFPQVKIEGGTINGTTIGFTTPTTIAGTTIVGTTITATTGFTGNVTGNVTGTATGLSGTPNIIVGTVTGTTITSTLGFVGNITSTTGTSTFSTIDVNGGNIDGTIIGAASAATITGTTITATTGFIGNLTGDVYNASSNKILENGSGAATSNGGYPNAFFYGTSSYATQALTAAYAAAGGSAINGVPIGGSQYQILAKNSATPYDVGWTNPITSSIVVSASATGDIVVWGGFPQREITSRNNFRFNQASQKYVCDVLFQSNKFTSDNGITVTTGAVTGSFVGYNQTKTISSPSNLYQVLLGHKNSFITLKLSASGYCTMSLMRGQTTSVLVTNNGSFSVSKWSGSLDGGATATTKVYWSANGPGMSPTYTPTITYGIGKKDLITFVNVDDKIIGTIVQDFR